MDDIVALERIEREAWRSLAAAAPPDFAQAVGLACEPMGDALFMMASRIPAFQFNWLAGASLATGGADLVSLAVARFREAGQDKFTVQIPPGPHGRQVIARAESEGLAKHPLAWAKFRRATANAPRIDSPLIVREAAPDEADLFAATAVAGFGMPPPMGAWLKQIVGRTGWRCFVSLFGDEPAGAAALFLQGDYAWLGIGATKPEMRKRGGQSALLARRLEEARRAGARVAVTETGVPQPGEPAPSCKNILAAGFQIAYVRPNWAPRS